MKKMESYGNGKNNLKKFVVKILSFTKLNVPSLFPSAGAINSVSNKLIFRNNKLSLCLLFR